MPREAIIKEPRPLEIDGGAWFDNCESFAKVADDLEESNGDRSVGGGSSDVMLLSTGA